METKEDRCGRDGAIIKKLRRQGGGVRVMPTSVLPIFTSAPLCGTAAQGMQTQVIRCVILLQSPERSKCSKHTRLEKHKSLGRSAPLSLQSFLGLQALNHGITPSDACAATWPAVVQRITGNRWFVSVRKRASVVLWAWEKRTAGQQRKTRLFCSNAALQGLECNLELSRKG